MKKIAGDIIILNIHTKNHNHIMYSPEIRSKKIFFVILGHFLPFYQLFSFNDLENKNFEKKKKRIKCLETLSFYTYMCTINEDHDIWFLKFKVRQTEIFVILSDFLPFQSPDNPENQNFKIEKTTWRYYHFTKLQHKWHTYDLWLQRYGAQQTFLAFWTIFCRFTHPTTRKIKILKKLKKAWRYYHFIHFHHNWQSYAVWFLRYWAWQTELLPFWTILCPFTSLTTRKSKFWKNKKEPGDIIILHMCIINDNHMMYGSWDMKHDTKFFVILDHFLSFYPSNSLKNQNFKKKKQKPADIIILQ